MRTWTEVDIPTHRMSDAKWVKCVAIIRHNASGEIRRHETNAILNDGKAVPDTFIWTSDGNFGCDCNRKLFFDQAVGIMDTPDHQCPCGEGAFSVNLENQLTGEIYYREFES